ncbi:MAG: glutamate--cysteine ligase [Alphaproteobacteria bacterium]|nr:glutamate--cysteine ligase [Alphaproteobacteria bacterium]
MHEILFKQTSLKREKIAEFFAQKFAATPPLFYNSVDLRHNGLKLAPIDTNCFPAGFNNLSFESKILAKKITNEAVSTKKILIIPENHTRNQRYWLNVASLIEILSEGREVGVGTLIPLEENGIVPTFLLQEKDLHEADLVVLNNDLTNGAPEILANVKTVPPVKMGWHLRRKSNHFTIYNLLAAELAEILEIDPWLISSMHRSCDEVNFKEKKGVECLAQNVDELIKNIRKKYQEYGINDEPYCYIKADNGTYGIAVWPVFSGQEVLEINKKERNKMNMLKGSIQTQKVMIQEGIRTDDKIDGKIAEPMIYLINGQVVGNLFRVNETRDEKISLNSPGANFFDLQNLTEDQLQLGIAKDQITETYSLVARLAALASSIENQ